MALAGLPPQTGDDRPAQIARKPPRHQHGLPPPTLGALSELQVAVDLMAKGYHVFRALSPDCPCDLVAFRPGEPPVRIEVMTVPRSPGL